MSARWALSGVPGLTAMAFTRLLSAERREATAAPGDACLQAFGNQLVLLFGRLSDSVADATGV
jgi:hypothetical protein